MVTLLKNFCTHSIELFFMLLAPPYCAFCRVFLDERFPLCCTCLATIEPVISVKLPITASVQVTVHALGNYTEPLQTLIRAKNYHNHVASKQLGQLLHHRFAELIKQHDVIIPLPLHWTRYAWRGFNQAEIMAQTLSQHAQIPTKNILKRRKRTRFQASLSAAARTGNVNQAFIIATKDYYLYKDKNIVLIDDLMTTGSTLKEAAKTLLALKPASITIIVGARVV